MIIKPIRITAGRRHVWLDAELGGMRFNIKKPITDETMQYVRQLEARELEAAKPARTLSWWRRFINWIIGLIKSNQKE